MAGLGAGIHELRSCSQGKSWIPAFAGMTWGAAEMLASDLIGSLRA
jgi:hypothetical protein